jgi:hypothetical protein
LVLFLVIVAVPSAGRHLLLAPRPTGGFVTRVHYLNVITLVALLKPL